MRLSHRVFIIEGDSITRIPQKTFDAFYSKHEPALPGYANQVVTIALVIYELKDRRPTRIVRIDTSRHRVAADGSIDRERFHEELLLTADRMSAAFSGATPKNSNAPPRVVDAKKRFDSRRWDQLHPPLAGPAHKRILEDLFGGG